jgi:Fe-S-cluster containining protein
MIYQMDLNNFKNRSITEFSSNKKLVRKLKIKKPKELDQMFSEAHEKAFSNIDCLKCANCCKTTSPIFLQTDIERLSKVFGMRNSEFIEQYLKRDEDGDYVLNLAPCPFLNQDNTCLVYEERPKACRGYPHTNRKNMHGILDLTLKNSLICPAVHEIFQDFEKVYRK